MVVIKGLVVLFPGYNGLKARTTWRYLEGLIKKNSYQAVKRCRRCSWFEFSFVNFGNKEDGADPLVMGWPEVFGEVVVEVFTSGLPLSKKVALFYTVSYPV